MQALDFSLLLLSVNHDQDLCKMIIFLLLFWVVLCIVWLKVHSSR